MKKIRVLLLGLVVLTTACGATQHQKRATVASRPVQADWADFSYGMYYKSRSEYQTAIKYFMDAAAYKTRLDAVYYQLADCYFRLYDYENAVNYADLSIKENPDYARAYFIKYSVYSTLMNYEKAAESLEPLAMNHPEMVNVHYTLGNLYYSNLKNLDKAMVYFRNIVEIAASETVDDYYVEYSHYYLGYIYYSKGQIDTSIEHFKKCIEVNPDNFSSKYILAFVYMDQYSLDNARFYAEEYLKKFPGNDKINTLLGRIYYLQNDGRALTHLRNAIDSKTTDGRLAKCLYLELLRRDDDAEKALKEFLKKSTGFISPHIALGRVSLRKNDKTTALSEFFTAGILLFKAQQYTMARDNLVRALAIKNDIPELYFYLARTYEETGNFSLAIVHYKKTNDLKPSSDILIHIGYLYSLKNNFEEASKYLDTAISLEPGNSKPYFFKGLLYSRRDNYTSAESCIKKALSIESENETYYFYLATVQEKQSKIQDTIESLKKAIQYNPESSRAYNFLGYLYADNNMHLDESINLIKKALSYEPSNGAYLDSLGWAYYRKGRYDLALQNLLEAEKQLEKESSPDPVVFDHIGDTYREMGDSARALDYWGKSLKLKNDPKISNKIQQYRQGHEH